MGRRAARLAKRPRRPRGARLPSTRPLLCAGVCCMKRTPALCIPLTRTLLSAGRPHTSPATAAAASPLSRALSSLYRRSASLTSAGDRSMPLTYLIWDAGERMRGREGRKRLHGGHTGERVNACDVHGGCAGLRRSSMTRACASACAAWRTPYHPTHSRLPAGQQRRAHAPVLAPQPGRSCTSTGLPPSPRRQPALPSTCEGRRRGRTRSPATARRGRQTWRVAKGGNPTWVARGRARGQRVASATHCMRPRLAPAPAARPLMRPRRRRGGAAALRVCARPLAHAHGAPPAPVDQPPLDLIVELLQGRRRALAPLPQRLCGWQGRSGGNWRHPRVAARGRRRSARCWGARTVRCLAAPATRAHLLCGHALDVAVVVRLYEVLVAACLCHSERRARPSAGKRAAPRRARSALADRSPAQRPAAGRSLAAE